MRQKKKIRVWYKSIRYDGIGQPAYRELYKEVEAYNLKEAIEIFKSRYTSLRNNVCDKHPQITSK